MGFPKSPLYNVHLGLTETGNPSASLECLCITLPQGLVLCFLLRILFSLLQTCFFYTAFGFGSPVALACHGADSGFWGYHSGS